MLIKLILEARKAKIDWLMTVTEIPLHVILERYTVIVILEQQQLQCYLTSESYVISSHTNKCMYTSKYTDFENKNFDIDF